MVTIATQADCRAVQKIAFCYLCGEPVSPKAGRTKDHLPPETVFTVEDRSAGPVLWLPAHKACNEGQGKIDQKIGQLIALRRFERPSSRRDLQLKFQMFAGEPAVGALINLDIDEAVWRWIRGFHCALYGEYMPDNPLRALTTPFPRAQQRVSVPVFEQMKETQHRLIVDTIKTNRAKRNLDIIHTHAAKLRYEAVWVKSDEGIPMCFFCLDIYDWQDLGDANIEPRRGCAGFYTLPSGQVPATATKTVTSSILIPNLQPLDPFGR